MSVEIYTYIPKVIAAMDKAYGKSLEMIGITAEAFAKLELETPKPHANEEVRPNVDTGRLVNSITHSVQEQEKSVYIGTNVEYAPYVEMGTSRSKAYPYLKPAAEQHVEQYKKIVESCIKETLS